MSKKGGHNAEGLSEENKALLIDSLTEAYGKGQLIVDRMNDRVLDIKHNVQISLSSGNWLNSEAGQEKANRRAHVGIKCNDKKIMCADYNYITIVRVLLSNNISILKLLKDGYIVNHKNGDVQDNREQNHEVISNGDNALHASGLHCLALYFPKHVEIYKYMNGNKEMTQNILKNKNAFLSVEHIKEFNEYIQTNPTCKVYRMSPINTLKDRQGNYKEVPNLATIKFFICWLRKNYNIDLTPGEKIVDVVEQLKKEKEEEAYWKKQMEPQSQPVIKEVINRVLSKPTEEPWIDF